MKKNKNKKSIHHVAVRPVKHREYRRTKKYFVKKYGFSYYLECFLKYSYRIVLVVTVFVVLAVFALFNTLNIIAHGPSDSIRNYLVQSAIQASATKWVPGLFLDDATVDAIIKAGDEKIIEEVDVETPISVEPQETNDDTGEHGDDGQEEQKGKDGIEYSQISMNTFRAYIMVVPDPSKVFVGVSSNAFDYAVRGQRIYDAAEKYGAIAAINGGEFQDTGGTGAGEKPIGLTYSKGECVWNDGRKRTFIGFDDGNRLVVSESMTKEEADALNIRDGVSFQTGNTLISSADGRTLCYYAPDNNGKAQRTAIGQRADGTVILVVTDGRSASSIGATRDDIINLMIKYGAVTAGMLDGGSSAMMYYKNYIEKYDVDESTLDEYQKLGLVNKYKAFTKPRYLPTFFMVNPPTE